MIKETNMNKFRRMYQYLTAFTALLSILTSGLHYAWPSPSLPQLTADSTTSFQITNDEGSWIIIMQITAPIFSCFLGAAISDKIGRKKLILLTAIPYFVAWLMIAFLKSVVQLFIARFLVGLSDGIAFTVIPLFLAEISDPDIRGLTGAALSVFWIFGMLLINIIGSYLSITNTALVCSVLPILFVVTFFWMPESPYYLIMKNDLEGARSALRKFKGTSEVEEDLERLQEVVKNQNKKSRSILELFKKRSNQRRLLIMAILRNSQQMGGVAAISAYTIKIFNEAGDFMSPLSATVLYVSLQCIVNAVCSIVIDRTGRRPLLISSVLGSVIFLFVEGTYFYLKDNTNVDVASFNFVPVLALLGYVIVFNLGAQPIPSLIQGEIFPADVKDLASSLSEVYFCILSSTFSKLFQIMWDNFGIYLPFWFYAACSFTNLFLVVLFVPETKGKTLERIQKEMEEDNSNTT